MDRNILGVSIVSKQPESLSARRAWIEMARLPAVPVARRSLSARRAWIEMTNMLYYKTLSAQSLSARRAWIEIS